MSDFLQEMARSSRDRASRLDAAEMRDLAESAPEPWVLDVSSGGFDVIAEIKRRSPAEGVLGDDSDIVSQAAAYGGAGAVAISVLTEPHEFDGSLDHLAEVALHVDGPVMRKDFIVDPVQVLEARAAGASGVLLIARIVDSGLLAELVDLTIGLGMFPLVEVFELSDLEATERLSDREFVLGVNCRDLETLEVRPERFAEMARHLEGHGPTVAESGLATAADIQGVARLGYRLALVGSALMRSSEPASLLGSMIEAGRTAGASSIR